MLSTDSEANHSEEGSEGGCGVKWLQSAGCHNSCPLEGGGRQGFPPPAPPTWPHFGGPRDRVGHSRSVSGMELVMEELVEVMVLREGLMP